MCNLTLVEITEALARKCPSAIEAALGIFLAIMAGGGANAGPDGKEVPSPVSRGDGYQARAGPEGRSGRPSSRTPFAQAQEFKYLVFFAGQMHVDTTDRDSLGVEIDAKIANVEDRLRVPVRTAHNGADTRH
jgi:hypothetical protein